MEKHFKVGDIVQDGTFVSSITKIDGEMAILSKNYETKLNNLEPVEIRGGFDNGIILVSRTLPRASLIAPGKSIPIKKPKHYIESDIEGNSVKSIIERNGFKYIHELQDWLLYNVPDYYLKMRI